MKFEFFLGLDGISVALILLTTILSISSVLVSWTSIKDRAAEFYACLLIPRNGSDFGVFCSPLISCCFMSSSNLHAEFHCLFLVGIWGGPLRRYAAGKCFVYTLAGSPDHLAWSPRFAGGDAAVQYNPSLTTPFSFPALAMTFKEISIAETQFTPSMQITLFLMIAAGFMVKVPLFPFHTWLPLAHVEAPTAGSVLLAGVLLVEIGHLWFFANAAANASGRLLELLVFRFMGIDVPVMGTLACIGNLVRFILVPCRRNRY